MSIEFGVDMHVSHLPDLRLFQTKHGTSGEEGVGGVVMKKVVQVSFLPSAHFFSSEGGRQSNGRV